MSKNPKEASKEPAKEDFFGKKGYLSRIQLRERLRKASPKIPGSTKWYTRQQRINLEKEVFAKGYGDYITRQEYQRRLRELSREKFKVKTSQEKIDINRKIRYLKKLGGF